jgi:hypothetical protein
MPKGLSRTLIFEQRPFVDRRAPTVPASLRQEDGKSAEVVLERVPVPELSRLVAEAVAA